MMVTRYALNVLLQIVFQVDLSPSYSHPTQYTCSPVVNHQSFGAFNITSTSVTVTIILGIFGTPVDSRDSLNTVNEVLEMP